MDKHKEPMRLEDLAREKLNSMIRKVCENWTYQLQIAIGSGPKNLTRKLDFVRKESLYLRIMLSEITVPLVGQLVVIDAVNIILSLISSYDERRQPSLLTRKQKRLHYNICETMLSAVLLPCVDRYDVKNEKSEFVQQILLGLVYVVPNIKFLQPPEGRYAKFHVLNSLPFLTELREFHYRNACTNEVVFKIVEYCPKLHTIDFQYSHIDDSCLSELLKCELLRRINISDTFVTDKGYATLLSNMQIINIVWSRPIDRVLLHVTELPSVKTFVGTFSDTTVLSQKCPNITQLNVLSATVSVSNLQELIYIKDMKIFQCNYIRTNLGTLIHNLGSRLVVLEFYLVTFVAVDTIVNYCTSLTKLELSYCLSTRSTINVESEHFKSVRDLRLTGGNWDYCDYISILHLYVNLENIVAIGIESLNDNAIQNILQEGGFTNLRQFIVENCGDMGTCSAWNLIQYSPNLTKLGNVNFWIGFSEENVMQVEDFIRDNNLSLEIIR